MSVLTLSALGLVMALAIVGLYHYIDKVWHSHRGYPDP